MSTKMIVFNFKNLCDLSSNELHEAAPPEKAVQLTLDSVRSKEASIEEIYKTWAEVLFPKYGPSKILIDDLNQLLDVFLLEIKELLKECMESGDEVGDIKLLPFLDYSVELFTWIRSVANDIGAQEIGAFLCFGLSLANSYLAIVSNDRKFSKILDKSVAIQAVILGILSENSKSFRNEDRSLLTNLITHLCGVGEVTPKLDIKTAVDTWKAITKLISQIATLSKKNPSDDNDWLKRPMQFLVNEIGRNVQVVYQETSLIEPIEQVEKYLKVTNFYLRLLQKIATDFRHVNFPVCKEFINTLTLTLGPPTYILKTPVEKLVTELIASVLKELIPFVYRNTSFFEHLLKNDSQFSNSSGVLQEILFDVIEIAIRRNEADCLNHKLFKETFESCLKNRELHVSSSMYNRFVEVFGALQIYFQLDVIHEALIDNILQDNMVPAMSAIDIWCIFFKSSKHSSRLSYFTFWRNMNEKFSKFSASVRATYPAVLLRNLYALLTNQEKLEIWSKLDVCSLCNDRFLLTIGLNAIPSIHLKQTITQHFIDELQKCLRESPNHMTVDNFYTIVKNLKLLTPSTYQNAEIIQVLLCFLDVAFESDKFSLLVESILDFLIPRLEHVDDGEILKILTRLSQQLCVFQGWSTRLCFVRFLRAVSGNPRLRIHSEEILKPIESNKLIKYFGNFGNTQQTFVTSKNRSQEMVDSFEDDLPAKKMKTEIDCVLESMEKSVDQLQALTQFEEMNSARKRAIGRIISKLHKVGGLS